MIPTVPSEAVSGRELGPTVTSEGVRQPNRAKGRPASLQGEGHTPGGGEGGAGCCTVPLLLCCTWG